MTKPNLGKREASQLLTIRIPKATVDALKKLAEEDHRTLNNLAVHVLMKFVEERRAYKMAIREEKARELAEDKARELAEDKARELVEDKARELAEDK